MPAPPHWSSYVTVEDADATAAKAKEPGAQLLAEPFDVMEAGRMAVLQDSEGAVVSAWQPNQNTGAGLVNEHGTLCWNELMSNDPEAAKSFYTQLFGWTTEPFREDYTIVKIGDRGNGGILKIGPEMGDAPPHWAVYFASNDVDASVEAVTNAGSSVMVPAFDTSAASPSLPIRRVRLSA